MWLSHHTELLSIFITVYCTVRMNVCTVKLTGNLRPLHPSTSGTCWGRSTSPWKQGVGVDRRREAATAAAGGGEDGQREDWAVPQETLRGEWCQHTSTSIRVLYQHAQCCVVYYTFHRCIWWDWTMKLSRNNVASFPGSSSLGTSLKTMFALIHFMGNGLHCV